VTIQCFGAAITALTFSNVSYAEANSRSLGDLIHTILSPPSSPHWAHFGDFLTVLISLSVIGNIAATFYSICFNIQLLIPFDRVARVPRWAFSVLAFAMCVIFVSSVPVL
jgi:purine-cytosine permease-like protein